MKQTSWKTYVGWAVPIVLFAGIIWTYSRTYNEGNIQFGFTFSAPYAEQLNLDPQEVYVAMLSDLGVRNIRLPIYWNRVAPTSAGYVWDEIDWQLEQAQQYGAQVTVAIGHRLPRWPECHAPLWLNSDDTDRFEQALLDYIQAAVIRYRDHPAVIRWQVENEPFLSVFGECPPLDRLLLDKEISLVRSLDTKPIQITESGELSTWMQGGARSDILGVSVYRVTWNDIWGYFYYPLPPAFYRGKRTLVEKFSAAQLVINSELQVEPWTATPIETVPVHEQFVAMDLETIKRAVAFVADAGFEESFLWGVEWWYWLRTIHNRPEFWEYGRQLFAS